MKKIRLRRRDQKKARSVKRGKRRWKRPSRAQLLYQLQIFLLVFIGTIIVAFGYALFQVPNNIAAGGLSGIGIIVASFTGLPVGLLFWVMNIPLLAVGFWQLGRWPFLLRTLFAATIFAVATDLFVAYLPFWMPSYPLSDDLLLNTVYGGVVGGIGGGLIYRGGASMGGTGIIGRIIQQKTGQPLSQVYFYTDGLIIVAAGIVFGWEIALYAFLMLFLNGLASDYTLEGPSSTRTATIITNNPEPITHVLLQELHRGVSYWPVTGGYTGADHYLVLCTITRPQVARLKQVVARVDPHAFVSIGISHDTYGYGFAPLLKELHP